MRFNLPKDSSPQPSLRHHILFTDKSLQIKVTFRIAIRAMTIKAVVF